MSGSIALVPAFQQKIEIWTPKNMNSSQLFKVLFQNGNFITGYQWETTVHMREGRTEFCEKLKVCMAVTTAPILTLPTSKNTFILDTDASDFTI